MARPDCNAFLDLARRSGLVEQDQLEAFHAAIRKGDPQRAAQDVEFVAARLVESGLATRWQCEMLLAGRFRGFFLGKYKLLGMLGVGGTSTVYLAEHVLMQRRVAIRVLPKLMNGTAYLARFQREAQAAAALDHPNIARTYDADNEGDIHYLVMEYVEGRDLQQMVKEDGPLEYAAAAEYIRQAAEGLAHAHAAGLIHRDIKPANLRVDRNNLVKVLDFGLARFTAEDRASSTGQYDENVLGTADYLAPEQAIDSHGVDARADVYSLGCTFYFLLTGHPPFSEGTLPQRLMAHQKESPPSILKDRPDAPAGLVEICMRMMAKRPADRYDSMGGVARALESWLADHGHGPQPGSKFSSSKRRHYAAPLTPRQQQWLVAALAPVSEGPDRARPCVFDTSTGSLESLVPKLSRSLQSDHLVYCPIFPASTVQRQLLKKKSRACRSLHQYFRCLIVLDAKNGCNKAGEFHLAQFYRFVHARLVKEFGLEKPLTYHEEDIVQFLRDEPESLVCLLNVHLVPHADRAGLRSLTQEKHRVLVVYQQAENRAPSPRRPKLERALSDTDWGDDLEFPPRVDRRAGMDSRAKPGETASLPKAKPLDVVSSAESSASSSDLVAFLSPGTATPTGKPNPTSRHARQQAGPPGWVWMTIGGGFLIGLVLLIGLLLHAMLR